MDGFKRFSGKTRLWPGFFLPGVFAVLVGLQGFFIK